MYLITFIGVYAVSLTMCDHTIQKLDSRYLAMSDILKYIKSIQTVMFSVWFLQFHMCMHLDSLIRYRAV